MITATRGVAVVELVIASAVFGVAEAKSGRGKCGPQEIEGQNRLNL